MNIIYLNISVIVIDIAITWPPQGAKSKNLQANTAACLSSLAKNHRENQDLIVASGGVKPLVSLAKSTRTLCQVKAAGALESLATNNSEAQRDIDVADAQRPLIRLLKMWAIEVKEQGQWICHGMRDKRVGEIQAHTRGSWREFSALPSRVLRVSCKWILPAFAEIR